MMREAVGIDFSDYITDRTQDFIGREAVFQYVADWLSMAKRARFFLLTGEPGSGKSAIVGQLARLSSGLAQQGEYPALPQGFLSAVHFCSTRDRDWINPLSFARSLSLQLAHRHPGFAQALVEVCAEQQIHIEIKQDVRQNNGEVIGVKIQRLEIESIIPEDAFRRVVRKPLEAFCHRYPDENVVILIDALDEGLQYHGGVTIPVLIAEAEYLPPSVLFLVTSRPGVELLHKLRRQMPPPGEYSLTDAAGLAHSMDDIYNYVLHAMSARPEIAARLAPDLSAEALAGSIRDRSQGNFLYVKYLLEMLGNDPGEISRASLDQLPIGLDAVYLEFLERLTGADIQVWETRYAPLLGILCVAQEGLTEDQLAGITGADKAQTRRTLSLLRQLLDANDSLPPSQRAFALYHRSFADFLLDSERAENYWCEAARQHRRIIDHYLASGEHSPRSWDVYGLRYAASHLAMLAEGAGRSAPLPTPDQHALTCRLVQLVTAPGFQAAHQERIGDISLLPSDLERALQCAICDDHPDASLLVVVGARALSRFRRKKVRPQAVFDLARAGAVKDAERQAGLFVLSSEWHQMTLLTIAWLAAASNHAEACSLRDRVKTRFPRNDAFASNHPLPPFTARLDALLDGTQLPTDLQNYASSPSYAAKLKLHIQGLRTGINREYVKSSLLNMMTAIVRQDNDELIQSLLPDVLGIVMSANDLDEPEGVAIALQALKAKQADVAALDRLDISYGELFRRLDSFQSPGEPDELWEMRVAPENAQDLWGTQLREATSLAVAFSLLLNRQEEAEFLLQKAMILRQGFSSFLAPAFLTLAEAIHLCHPREVTVDEALELAASKAYTVQEPYVSLRMIAKVRAMRMRWWKDPAAFQDMKSLVARFCQNPTEPEFTAMHIIGGTAMQEVGDLRKMPRSIQRRDALFQRVDTLSGLSAMYHLPLADFRQVNGNAWEDNQRLSQGTVVNVPDPEFAPLLAVRFAAEALASLPRTTCCEVIKRLVPAAVPNTTALNTVLSLALLASDPNDLQAIKISDEEGNSQKKMVTFTLTRQMGNNL